MRWVRLQWWETTALILPISIALLLLVTGSVIAGVVAVALTGLIVASRARIVERSVAGSYSTMRGWVIWAKALALFTIYIVIVVLFWVGRRDDWHETAPGTVATWALGGLAFFVAREVFRLGRAAQNHWRGGDEERLVGELLDTLRDEGFVVSHDLPRESGGNVDHLVGGPRGMFAIETKAGRSNASARAQAVSNAIWAKEKFGQRFVTAVLCVGTDPPSRVVKNSNAWVLGRDRLLDFLRTPPRWDATTWTPPS